MARLLYKNEGKLLRFDFLSPFTREELDSILSYFRGRPALPNNIYPADGATDIFQFPEFLGSDYTTIHQLNMAAMGIEIYDDINPLNMIYKHFMYQSNTSFWAGDFYGIIENDKTYYWRIRYQGTNGQWSDWSSLTSFTTASVFAPVVIRTPRILYPSLDNQPISEIGAVIFGSPFETLGGVDTHESSDWEVSNNPSFDPLIESTADDTTNLISYPLQNALVGPTYVRVRYKGTTTPNKSEYSYRRLIRPIEKYVDYHIGVGYRVTSIGTLQLHHIDLDGNDIDVAETYFDNHPLFQFTPVLEPIPETPLTHSVEMHMASILPVWNKVERNLNASLGEDRYRIWISPEKADSNFYLNPAFAFGGNKPIEVAQYCAWGAQNSSEVNSRPDLTAYTNTDAYRIGGLSFRSNNVVLTRLNGWNAASGYPHGWRPFNVYDYKLLLLMAAIEYEGFKTIPSAALGWGNVSSSNSSGKYRTIYMLNCYRNPNDQLSSFGSKWAVGVWGFYRGIPNQWSGTSQFNYQIVEPYLQSVVTVSKPATLFPGGLEYDAANQYSSILVRCLDILSGESSELGIDLELLNLPTNIYYGMNEAGDAYNLEPSTFISAREFYNLPNNERESYMLLGAAQKNIDQTPGFLFLNANAPSSLTDNLMNPFIRAARTT